jgi:transposase-like protein
LRRAAGPYISLLVSIAVNADGYREILGICEGAKEDKAGWSGFLKHLKERGLKGVQLVISDACLGLSESISDFFPEAHWQRCTVGSLKNLARMSAIRRSSAVSAWVTFSGRKSPCWANQKH